MLLIHFLRVIWQKVTLRSFDAERESDRIFPRNPSHRDSYLFLSFFCAPFSATHQLQKIIPGWVLINAVRFFSIVPLRIELASRKRLSLMGFCHCCCLEAATKSGLVGYQQRSSGLLTSSLQTDAICRWSAPCRHLGHIDWPCPPPGHRRASASVFTLYAGDSARQLLLCCSCSGQY